MDDDDDLLLDKHNVIEPSNEHNDHKSIESVREWFIWSYLNVLMGGVILGLIAIACSLRTNKFKERQNYLKAKKWSYVTFIVNFLTTLSSLTYLEYLIFRYFFLIYELNKRLLWKEKRLLVLFIQDKT
jgi:H+/Cl- antiporter ClcA